MVVLVWSGPGLPTVTKASRVPDDPFWLVWSRLPILTMPPFWVDPPGVWPLPIITTAKAHDTQYGDYVLCGVIMC
jgi:hypothetical protein